VDVTELRPRCDDAASTSFVGLVVLPGAVNSEELSFSLVASALWRVYKKRAGLGRCGPSISARFHRMVAEEARAPVTSAAAAAAAADATAAAARGWRQSDEAILAATQTVGKRWTRGAPDELLIVKAVDCGTGTAYLNAATMYGPCLVEMEQEVLEEVPLEVPAWMIDGGGGGSPFCPPEGFRVVEFDVSDPGFDDGSDPCFTVCVPGERLGDNLKLQVTLDEKSISRGMPGWQAFNNAVVKCDLYDEFGHGSILLEAQGEHGDPIITALRVRYSCAFGHMELVITTSNAGCTLTRFELDSQDLP
jgi:hypothetical protein